MQSTTHLGGTSNGLVWLEHSVCFGDWQGMSLGKEGRGSDSNLKVPMYYDKRFRFNSDINEEP